MDSDNGSTGEPQLSVEQLHADESTANQSVTAEAKKGVTAEQAAAELAAIAEHAKHSVFPLRPYDDRVIVITGKMPDKTPGGIVLPESAKDRPTRGIVLRVGCGRLLISGALHPVACKPGDTVYFGMYDGREIEIGSKTVRILKENDIMAVMDC